MTPIRQLIEQATPESDAAKAQLEAIRSLIELSERLSPAVMLAVVEALTDAHLYIDDGLEGSPAKRAKTLLQIEAALNLLNGHPAPAPQPEKSDGAQFTAGR